MTYLRARDSQKGSLAAAGEGPATAPMPPDRAKAKDMRKNIKKAERERYDSRNTAERVSVAAPKNTLKAANGEAASKIAAIFWHLGRTLT